MENRQKKKKIFSAISHIYAVLIYAFFYIPVVVMVVFSFNDSRNNIVWNGFTTRYYVELMGDKNLWMVFFNTVIIALASTIISTVIGTLGAVGFNNAKFKGKGIIAASLYFPIVIPEIVLAVASLILFNLSNVGLSMLTMILGNATLVLPYVFISVKARLFGMDPSIEEASLDLGANRFWTFINITLPGILPGVISGVFMAFTLTLEDLVISSFLADPGTTTLPIKVYSMLKKGLSPEINALTTVVLLAFLLGLGIFELVTAIKKWKEKSRDESIEM